MKYYDLAISLGGSCAEAGQLAKRELRPASLPFDWLWSRHTQTIRALANHFREDFAHWLDPKNLRLVDENEKSKDGTDYQYCDDSTGYYFIHDFFSPKEQSIGEVRALYRRRIARLTNWLRKASEIALLYDSCEDEGVVGFLGELRATLMGKYPNLKKIDIYFWQYEAATFEDMHHVDDGIYVMRVLHKKSDYIFKQKSFEYACMDDWRMTGKVVESGRKSNRLYMRRSESGYLVVLWKNISRRFRLLISFGKRDYEFRIGT